MEEHLKDIQQIRYIMERSGRFLSLSGVSGVMAGIYAMAGAILFSSLYNIPLFSGEGEYQKVLQYYDGLWSALVIAASVLLLSVGTGLLMSLRKARKGQTSWWSAPARMLMINMLLPLLTGGIICIIVAFNGLPGLVPGLALVFYGLALFAGSRYTFSDIKYLGICEVLLGILAVAYPGYGLITWFTGFGLLHIIYGIIMYFRFEYRKEAT